jgi:hypothetical protein
LTQHGSLWIRLAAASGVFVAIGVFLLVTFIAPDHGPTSIAWRQGLALMVVFAAPAVAALVTPVHAPALGGAMFVAGAITMLGGNVPLLLMTASGFLLLLAASTQAARVTTDLLVRFALLTIALVTGVYLALDTAIITGLGALSIAALVVISGLWPLVP